MRISRALRPLAFVVAATLVVAACGGGDDGDGGGTGGGAASGDITISGSSTVEPVSVAVAEKFSALNGDVAVSVDGPGTGDGFELFCNGDTDISDASRAIQQEEVESCAANGIEFVELKIAYDGIAVLTSPENDAVECLTVGDLYALVGPESQGVGNWADAGELASELGSSTDLPELDLVVTAPGEESGTYDSFVELALQDIAEDRGEEPVTRPDYQSSPNDNVIIEGMQGGEGSLGWVGYAYAAQAGESVKTIAVDGGDGCVEPSAETIADGSYPLSRPLFIYVDAAKAAERPELAQFVDFYLGEGISSVEETGYVPLPADELAETVAAWEARETGTREG